MTLLTVLLISIFAILSCHTGCYVSAFTVNSGINTLSTPTTSWKTATKHFMVSDGSGTDFTEGCTIQISTETKAYQVARKGFGSYDEQSGSFVPLDFNDDTPRVDRCLVLPKGLRGTVMKVYDMNEFDASMPIVAKFTQGENFGGKFEPPVTFLMHFDTHEVEVIE